MVVKTGPLLFLTTARSFDSGGAAPADCSGSDSANAVSVLLRAETTLPVITAAAPTTALRIRKERRSTPGGTSSETASRVSKSASSGDFSFSLLDMAHLYFMVYSDAMSINALRKIHTVRITRGRLPGVA